MPYNGVFIIISGKMGIYMFPNGERKLLSILKSKDLVGEYDLNFIAPKSSEYEALTNIIAIKITKEDYERAMNDAKIVKRNITANILK